MCSEKSADELNAKKSFTNYIIIGGGPVGCYLAYKLLEQANSRVFIFESRKFERPQVVRIPFCTARDVPETIKNTMWFDEETRTRIFSACRADDSNFWPRPGYLYWPFISVGLFQELFVKLFQKHKAYKDRFFFLPSHEEVIKLDLQEEINKLSEQDIHLDINKITAIFCTCGTYAKPLRKKLNLLDGKSPEKKGDGIYLTYQNKGIENYIRNGVSLSYVDLGQKGMTYAASNNYNYDVQLYTYPTGKLETVFNKIPKSFIHRAKYSSKLKALNLADTDIPEDAKKWLEDYIDVITSETAKVGIHLPADLKKINIFYALRTEYYWNNVATEMRWPENQLTTPLIFLGDSAGGTDYKLGLGAGRGFLAVAELINLMHNYDYNFNKVSLAYQTYWDKIIENEFNKDTTLFLSPWIQYHYLIQGREVNFLDNKTIQFDTEEQYKIYLSKL